MTRRSRVLALVAGASGLAVIAILAEPALACSEPLPPSIPLPEELRGVPIEGVLPLSTHARVIYVETLDGTPVAGAMDDRSELDFVVWRAAAPLEPTTRYRAYVSASESFEFETAAGPAPRLDQAPEVRVVSLREVEVSAERACCARPNDSCSNWEEPCWTLAYQYPVELALEVAPVVGVDPRYVAITPSGASAIRFYQRASRYCVTVRAEDLVYQTTLTREVCADAASLVSVAHSEPQTPDASQCEHGLIDPRSGDPIDVADDDDRRIAGCRAGSDVRGSSGLLVLVALFLARRGRAFKVTPRSCRVPRGDPRV